jgi:hypothetical protein
VRSIYEITFTQQLQAGDELVIQYGTSYSIYRWNGLGYDAFGQDTYNPFIYRSDWQLVLSGPGYLVYRRILSGAA